MAAVYEQQAMPNNITGVPIIISVLDSNGNYRQIGTTTSSLYGDYSLTWTQDIAGNYTIIASFAGTQSYYSSSASTAFYASEPAPTASDLYFVPAIAGLFVFVAIMGVAIILVLRKRP
jgi:hypothetical protein